RLLELRLAGWLSGYRVFRGMIVEARESLQHALACDDRAAGAHTARACALAPRGARTGLGALRQRPAPVRAVAGRVEGAARRARGHRGDRAARTAGLR